jgi:hypothetical protein
MHKPAITPDVIPAKAGIHVRITPRTLRELYPLRMDPGLRRDDTASVRAITHAPKRPKNYIRASSNARQMSPFHSPLYLSIHRSAGDFAKRMVSSNGAR